MNVRIEFRQSASTDFKARLLGRILVSSAFRVPESSISVNRGNEGGTIRYEFESDRTFRDCEAATDALYVGRLMPEFGEVLRIQCLAEGEGGGLNAFVSYGGGDRSIYSNLLDLFAMELDADEVCDNRDFYQLCEAFPALYDLWDEYCLSEANSEDRVQEEAI